MSTHIPKLRVPVRLSEPNQDPRDGWFLLLPQFEQDERPETVMELLNSSRPIIPFIETDDESVLLLTRANIDWVSVGQGVPTHLIFPPGPPVDVEQRVVLRLVDDSRVEATIAWRSEGKGVRLSDHLSSIDAFVAVKTRFGTLIVNKLRVRETRPVTTEAEGRGTSPPEDRDRKSA
jgi:hypothetical protein